MKKKLSELISAVLDGECSAEQALNLFDVDDGCDLIEGAKHQLMHYAADEDIRAVDAEYAMYQRQLLASWITKLNSVGL